MSNAAATKGFFQALGGRFAAAGRLGQGSFRNAHKDGWGALGNMVKADYMKAPMHNIAPWIGAGVGGVLGAQSDSFNNSFVGAGVGAVVGAGVGGAASLAAGRGQFVKKAWGSTSRMGKAFMNPGG